MGLGIENATIGYDENNVEEALSNLQTHVIQDTINEMGKGLTTLFTTVDDAWQGQSADTFKNNLQHDYEKIKEALEESYNILKSEIYEIVNKMGDVDQNVIQARED